MNKIISAILFSGFISGLLSPAYSQLSDLSAPARVISLSPLGTKTIYLLGSGDRLVGNTTYCNKPPAAKRKEKIGTITQIQIEKVLALAPDLIIACPLTNRRQLNHLNHLGLKTMEIPTPKTFNMMCDNTIMLGNVIGKKQTAEKIIKTARKEIKALIKYAKGQLAPKVFVQIGIRPLHTANSESFINEYITFCKAENIAAQSSSGLIGIEEVIVKNPDVILIATMGSSKKAAESERKKWLRHPSINAVKNKRVYILDPDIICSPTPVDFVEGLKVILPLIHPGIDSENKIKKGENK